MLDKNIYIKLFLGILLMLLAFLGGIKLIDELITDRSTESQRADFSYFEDESDHFQINDIKELQEEAFTSCQDGMFNFGRSKSTYWIRVSLTSVDADTNYITIHCPNLQDVTLYYRTKQGERIKCSGWGNTDCSQEGVKEGSSDEDMTYPVFSIQDIDSQEPVVYLRIESVYSHIYNINIISDQELSSEKKLDYILNSACFSILFTIIIINLCIFFALKSKVSLYFDICIICLCLNQGCTTGFYNLLPGSYAKWIMQYSIELGFLYLISLIVFFLFLSEVKNRNKNYYRTCLVLIAGCLGGIFLCRYDKVTANLIAHVFCIVVALFITFVSFLLSSKNQLQNVFFLVGWNITTIIYAAFILSVEGILKLKSDIWGFHNAIFMIIIVAAIFTIASIRYTRTIQMNNLLMQQQVTLATDRIKHTENVLLQTQIKPHFLYNTLTAIEQLCEIDGRMAQKAVTNFADYLRNNIDFSFEAGVIPIEKEIRNVKCYLDLEKMRYEERLNVEYNILAGHFMIPPFVIQPMVENAVRHGIMKKREGGTIRISIEEENECYKIYIMDDGIGFDLTEPSDEKTSHIGIENARERIERLSKGTMNIVSKNDQGTKVTITIPKER